MAFKMKGHTLPGIKQNEASALTYSNAELGVTSKTASFSHKDYDDLNWRERSKLRRENRKKTKGGVAGYGKETTPRPSITQRLKNLFKSNAEKRSYSK